MTSPRLSTTAEAVSKTLRSARNDPMEQTVFAAAPPELLARARPPASDFEKTRHVGWEEQTVFAPPPAAAPDAAVLPFAPTEAGSVVVTPSVDLGHTRAQFWEELGQLHWRFIADLVEVERRASRATKTSAALAKLRALGAMQVALARLFLHARQSGLTKLIGAGTSLGVYIKGLYWMAQTILHAVEHDESCDAAATFHFTGLLPLARAEAPEGDELRTRIDELERAARDLTLSAQVTLRGH
jgi:hypothetical protein